MVQMFLPWRETLSLPLADHRLTIVERACQPAGRNQRQGRAIQQQVRLAALLEGAAESGRQRDACF